LGQNVTGVRVLHLTDNLRAGGVQRVVVDLVKVLHDRGYVTGVAAEDTGELWNELPAAVGRYHAPPRKGAFDNLRYILWLRKTLRSDDWQLVHAHQRGVSLIARIAALGTPSRVVEHVHNVFSAHARVRRAVSFRGHELIACGTAVFDMLVDDFGRPAERVSIIRNAVPDRGKDINLDLPCLAGTTPRIIGIGRLAPQKDPMRFVEVVQILNRQRLQVTAEWVGDGQLHEALADKVSKDGVQGIKLSGFSRNVTEKLCEADVLLIPSRWEGLPLVALEAMSLGRGIIAADVGSCRDVVEHGRNGVLFHRDASPAEIAKIVQDALDGGQLHKWGYQSRKMYLKQDGPEGMVARVESIYCRAFNCKRRGLGIH
jgi:glycosyltransferase involved in cell wall biosynthesis